MPGVPVFLCAWHVKRAWLSNLTGTVADSAKRTEIWHALDGLMRINVQLPADHSPEDLTKLCEDALAGFYKKFSEQSAFINYFKKEWAGKISACHFCTHSLKFSLSMQMDAHGSCNVCAQSYGRSCGATSHIPTRKLPLPSSLITM